MPEMYSDSIGKLWRDCRQNAELTLLDVARINCHGIKVSYLSDFERGNLMPPMQTLVELFEIVGYKLQITAVPIEEGQSND